MPKRRFGCTLVEVSGAARHLSAAASEGAVPSDGGLAHASANHRLPEPVGRRRRIACDPDRPDGVAHQVCNVALSDESVNKIESVLGYSFSDPSLLERALTHASIADDRLESNERLEFLGDAVLGYVVCEELYRQFEDLLEGELTKIKSAVVSRQLCARIAKSLGLDRMLSLGKGMQARDNLPSSLAAAVFESVIGAILLDGGIDEAKRFIVTHIAPHIEEAAASGHQQNFKSVLQQHAQARLDHQPVYILKSETGPDHAKKFEIAVQLGDRLFASSWASSKKRAEQKAALIALGELGLIHETRDGHVVYVPEEMFEERSDADE